MTQTRILRTLASGALALWLLVPGIARSQIYVGSDADTGAVVLSNFRSEEAAALMDGTLLPMQAPVSPKAPVGRAPPRREPAIPASAELRALIDATANRNKLSPALIHAVIRAESHYDPRAVSAKGAIGLMQLMPATGKRFGARDLFSAEQNIAAGASYLHWLMELFDGRLALVLAAYNAGEQAVINAGCRVPGYPETQTYVKRILGDLEGPTASSPGLSEAPGQSGCTG